MQGVDDAYLRQVESVAASLRNAFEAADRTRLMLTLQQFPGGACGDASVLLGHLLSERGLDTFHYVLGRWGDASHAWLQKDALVVDITADQFPDAKQPPVVVSLSSTWHAQLGGGVMGVAKLSFFGQATAGMLNRDYRYLKSLITR